MTALPKSIGWVGLGSMGFPMAVNLLDKTDPETQFYVYDVVQEPIDRFIHQSHGRAHACHSSKEVADKSSLILSMVPEGTHVLAAHLDPTTGLLASTSPPPDSPRILLDCSTVSPSTSQTVRSACASHPLAPSFYDAPVSGGVLGAERATLTFMLGCGASDPLLPLLTSALGRLGSHIVPCGGPGLGLTAKLCNNYCSGLIAVAVSEAMDIGIRSGIDPRLLANVFHTSTAQSAICDDWCPVPGICPEAPASKGYAGGFRVELMRKDFGLAVEEAERVGARLALGREGLGVYEGASAEEGCRGRDSRVVYRFLGGREDWRGDFEGVEVGMARDRTRGDLRRGREIREREEGGN